MTKIIIRMCNSGGELDRVVIDVPDADDPGSMIADALEAMVSEMGIVHVGDTFTVREA